MANLKAHKLEDSNSFNSTNFMNKQNNVHCMFAIKWDSIDSNTTTIMVY